MSTRNNNQVLIAGLMAAASASLLLWYISTQNQPTKSVASGKGRSIDTTPTTKITATTAEDAPKAETKTEEKTIAQPTDDKSLHSQIEELDKKGKVLFKNKQVRDVVAAVDVGLLRRSNGFGSQRSPMLNGLIHPKYASLSLETHHSL